MRRHPVMTRLPLPRVRWAGLALAALLAACATRPDAVPAAAPAAASATAFVAPNPNLHVEGIPPVPQALADTVARYTDFRGHVFVDWHPTRREMLVAHRAAGASTVQLFRLAAPMAEPERLTDFADPVATAAYEPAEGRYLVFARASGGNEVTQLHRLDLASRAVTQITDPDQRHELQGFLWPQAGQPGRLLHTSVPLDRTAKGATRATVDTQLWLVDPERPDGRRLVATLPGGGWGVGAIARDNRRLALVNYLSANESQVWLMDLDGPQAGQRRQILPAPGQALKATHYPRAFARDGRSLFVVSDRVGEFNEMLQVALDDQGGAGAITRMTGHIPWDVSGGDLSDDGQVAALTLNEDGQERLRLFDGRSLKELPAPQVPVGSLGGTRFHPQGHELAFALNSAAGPSQVYTLDADSGRVQQWTRAYAPPGVDPARFAPQQIVRWKSFDGRTISGLLTLPPARFGGRRPVLINIHGGPEGQATAGFLNRNNYYVEELGIAILQPNVRGSSGYGKTFLALDNGMQREDSVKDIGALLDWIATQPHLDPARVVVIGGSYGGYMSLAVATHYADRIAGAIDVVGISHFVTFLNNTESYRRDLRRVEYGDEREPAMREFLERISPLSNAQKIRKPLFVVQGRNDPRVPYTEAEQIVQRARANGTPVWYLRAENEGHGFARKENADFQFYATVMFLRQTLKLD